MTLHERANQLLHVLDDELCHITDRMVTYDDRRKAVESALRDVVEECAKEAETYMRDPFVGDAIRRLKEEP